MNTNKMLLDYLSNQPPPEPEEKPQPKKLSDVQMSDWNKFIDFLESKGYRGSTEFDKKDKNLGQVAFDAYKKLNPNFTLNYADIPSVQQAILDLRKSEIEKLKAGKAKLAEGLDAGKDYEKFMPNLSPVDGWLGSKTSAHKFPMAFLNEYINGQKVTDMKPQGFVSSQ